MTGDPRTYMIPTVSFVSCDECDRENKVTIWDDLRTGKWVQDSFECGECGANNAECDGSSLDRGAANVLFVLWVTGAALILVGILGHSAWTWPLIGGGGWLLAATTIIAFFMGAKQGDHE